MGCGGAIFGTGLGAALGRLFDRSLARAFKQQIAKGASHARRLDGHRV